MKIREIGLVAFSLGIFVISFVAFSILGGDSILFYPIQENKVVENLTRIIYDFTISLLFFGFSALVVMFIEGLNLGVAFASKKLEIFDFLMILPVILSVYSAITIGRAILRDYKGVGTIYEVLKEAVGILILACVFAAFLGFVR